MIKSVKVIEVIEIMFSGGDRELWSTDGLLLFEEESTEEPELSDDEMDAMGAQASAEAAERMRVDAMKWRAYEAERKRKERQDERMQSTQLQRVPPPFDPREGPMLTVTKGGE